MKHWTAKERKHLTDSWNGTRGVLKPYEFDARMAKVLGRTPQAIAQRRDKLGLVTYTRDLKPYTRSEQAPISNTKGEFTISFKTNEPDEVVKLLTSQRVVKQVQIVRD